MDDSDWPAVLKPSEAASMTCLALAEIASDAGLPAGVLNVVTGLGAEAGGGSSSVEHPTFHVNPRYLVSVYHRRFQGPIAYSHHN